MMLSIGHHIVTVKIFFLSLLTVFFFVKLALFFKVEKGWDSLKFFHYSRIDLKMTTRRDLRTWRRRQNTMTNILIVLFLLFCVSSFFNMLIDG